MSGVSGRSPGAAVRNGVWIGRVEKLDEDDVVTIMIWSSKSGRQP
jgi:hypothetical protein